MTPLLVTTDPRLLRAAKAAATKAGRRDWKKMMQADAERLLRGLYGLDADCSPKEAAAIIGCHVNTIWNYASAGSFPHLYYTSSRRCRIPLADVLAVKAETSKAEGKQAA